MITFLLSIIFVFITSYSFGTLFNQILIKKFDFIVFDFGETIILGYFSLILFRTFDEIDILLFLFTTLAEGLLFFRFI